MPKGDKICWSDFSPIDSIKFTPRDFCETLDGGQSFRWNKIEDSDVPQYTGVFENNIVKLRLADDGIVWESHSKKNASSRENVRRYLDAANNYADIRQDLKSSRDDIMKRALEIYPTLRILRQNPAEAIMCFICSSSKRIVQIKQCVKLLAENLGDEIEGGVYALPTFERLADASIEKIAECKVGFRAGYLKKSAQKITADKFDPMELREMPYAQAKKYLTSLTGIGEKVADCILLFGASRFEAFPVDTWIKQAMTELYATSDNADEIRKFAAQKFGGNSGFAQQLIFAAKRNGMI